MHSRRTRCTPEREESDTAAAPLGAKALDDGGVAAVLELSALGTPRGTRPPGVAEVRPPEHRFPVKRQPAPRARADHGGRRGRGGSPCPTRITRPDPWPTRGERPPRAAALRAGPGGRPPAGAFSLGAWSR